MSWKTITHRYEMIFGAIFRAISGAISSDFSSIYCTIVEKTKEQRNLNAVLEIISHQY